MYLLTMVMRALVKGVCFNMSCFYPESNWQGSVEEAIGHTKRHYEGLLKSLRSELTAKYEREKITMAGEIRQLETRVANILKEQQRLSDVGILCHSSSSEVSGGEPGRPMSQVSQSVSEKELQRLRPLIRSAMTSVKRDMLALVSSLCSG